MQGIWYIIWLPLQLKKDQLESESRNNKIMLWEKACLEVEADIYVFLFNYLLVYLISSKIHTNWVCFFYFSLFFLYQSVPSSLYICWNGWINMNIYVKSNIPFISFPLLPSNIRRTDAVNKKLLVFYCDRYMHVFQDKETPKSHRTAH